MDFIFSISLFNICSTMITLGNHKLERKGKGPKKGKGGGHKRRRISTKILAAFEATSLHEKQEIRNHLSQALTLVFLQK